MKGVLRGAALASGLLAVGSAGCGVLLGVRDLQPGDASANVAEGAADSGTSEVAEGAPACGIAEASAGTVLLSDSFEDAAGPGCGPAWNQIGASLTLVSPGHGGCGHACLVCLTGTVSSYGLASTSMSQAGALQTLTAAAFVEATPDSGPADGAVPYEFLDILGTLPDGGGVRHSNSGVALTASWLSLLNNYPLSVDLYDAGVEVTNVGARAGDCFLVDDVLLLLR